MNIEKFFGPKPNFKKRFNNCSQDIQKLLTKFFKTLGAGTETIQRNNNTWYKTKYGFLSVRNRAPFSIAFYKGTKKTLYCHLMLRRNDLRVRLRINVLQKIPKSIWLQLKFDGPIYTESPQGWYRNRYITSLKELEESIKLGSDNFDR